MHLGYNDSLQYQAVENVIATHLQPKIKLNDTVSVHRADLALCRTVSSESTLDLIIRLSR